MLQLAAAHDKTTKLTHKKGTLKVLKRTKHTPEWRKWHEHLYETSKRIKKMTKTEVYKKIKQNWKYKPLHGKYLLRSQNADINTYNSCSRSKSFYQKLSGQNCNKRCWPKCWFFGKFEGTINHLVSGCLKIAPNECLHGHDRVGQYIHWKICQHYNGTNAKNWYENKPQKIAEAKIEKINHILKISLIIQTEQYKEINER